MSAISSHTFSQAFRKFVVDFRDHFHRNLGPCLFQVSLQRFDQDMRLRACLGLQDAQNEEVHNIELRRVQCHSSRAEIERKTRKETNADCFANCVCSISNYFSSLKEDHAMATGSEASEQFLVLSDSLGLHFVD